MNTFKSSAELKASAREKMFGHYGTAIGAVLIVMCIVGLATGISSILVDMTTLSGTILYYAITFFITLLAGVFASGTTYLFLKIICGRPASAGDIFQGFRLYPDKAILIQAWVTLLTYVSQIPFMILNYKMAHSVESDALKLMLPYALSLILAGVVSVILSLLYDQALYLLHDFPQYSARELLAKSRQIMKGHKSRLFYLYVSFLPLFLVSALSCGIAMLWLLPYMKATQTEFFLDLIQNKK